MPKLGVNIDHVATVRQARLTYEPDPVRAAFLAELGGADVITVHLREDRRHIQDRDLELLRRTVTIKLNLEMACAEEIVGIALQTEPEQVTVVPEKRQEITTEGGLDVVSQKSMLAETIGRFREKNIEVSLFVDPDPEQITAAGTVGADYVELHTGLYANARSESEREGRLDELRRAADGARKGGLRVNAGHGLTYSNVLPVIPAVRPVELHIGHSIIARAIYVGMERAVREMKHLVGGSAPAHELEERSH